MKIQCDVCEKEEASVFCTADEASLCHSCDHRVHHANKLASKHPRFSLLHPSFQDSPRCDICQERRAFLFCKEDRAILCRECDIPIHQANAHTQKHSRFLLTGIKLSASSSFQFQTPSYTNSNGSTQLESASVSPTPDAANSVATSSTISDYLMETLPGWHVEDFLDPSHPYGFCKAYDQLTSFMTPDPEVNLGYFWTKDLEIRGTTINLATPSSVLNGLDSEEVNSFTKKATNRKWIKPKEECTVPFISPSSIKKRPRQVW